MHGLTTKPYTVNPCARNGGLSVAPALILETRAASPPGGYFVTIEPSLSEQTNESAPLKLA